MKILFNLTPKLTKYPLCQLRYEQRLIEVEKKIILRLHFQLYLRYIAKAHSEMIELYHLFELSEERICCSIG